MEEAEAFLSVFCESVKARVSHTLRYSKKARGCTWFGGVSAMFSPGDKTTDLVYDARIEREDNMMCVEEQWAALTIDALVQSIQPSWQRVEWEFQLCRREGEEFLRLFARVTYRSHYQLEADTEVLARGH